MYSIISGVALAVLAGAVIYEIRRQKADWNKFNHSLEQLICSRR